MKISKKWFNVAFWSILIFGFIIRIIPFFGNNFYFTMDQAYFAVVARDAIFRGKIPLLGSPTSLTGISMGPIWQWVLTIFYLFGGGHPFSGNMVLIILNTVLLGVIMKKLSVKVSPAVAIATGIILQFSWAFYDTSRYAFDPFPLVALSFFLIFFLIDFLEGKNKSFLLAAIPVGLVVHTEMASFIPLFAFYLLAGAFGSQKKKLLKNIVIGTFLVSLFFLPHLISELGSDFWQTRSLLGHFSDRAGTFSNTQFDKMSLAFIQMIYRGSIVQEIGPGSIPFFLLAVLFIWVIIKKVKLAKNLFINRFIVLSTSLVAISWVFFSSNLGWHRWQTVYVAPLILVSVVLYVSRFPKVLASAGLIVIFLSQSFFFCQRYFEYLKPSEDQSVLSNELKAIDWVYQESGGAGFYVYDYLPSVLDYPYQYLFWWYGKGKYGYLPCEFSSYPGSPKLFIHGSMHYENPKRKCAKLRFLIVEPDKHTTLREAWLNELRKGTTLLKSSTAGRILLEKRLIENFSP